MNRFELWVDGSYNARTRMIGSAALIKYVDEDGVDLCEPITWVSSEIDATGMRNVLGEITAVYGGMDIILTLLKHFPSSSSVTIFYDYIGIENWITGKWQAKNIQTKRYRQFMLFAQQRVSLEFQHVTGHSNVYENELVDSLAKQSAGITT